jgi:hypothetical protein
MTGTQQKKTLVAVMRETGWWPSDLSSFYEDPETGNVSNSGQIVVLESVEPSSDPPFNWNVKSEETDSDSLSLPFKRYEMKCKLTTPPTFCTVLVAANRNAINPLTDCCALVPLGGLANGTLTPKGRIQLGQQAIIACLKIAGQWPHPLDFKKVPAMFPDAIRLEPGKPVVYDPAEWILDGEGLYRDEVFRTYLMRNARAKAMLFVSILVDKEKRPESIDPYQDCWANKLPFRDRIRSRLNGFKSPSPELCRAAIAVLLDSVGAWPPDRDIKKQKPERLEIRELLQAAISTLERFNPPSGSSAGEDIHFFRSMLAKHEDKPIHKNAGMALEWFRSLNTSLDKATSLEDLEQALARFHTDVKEMASTSKNPGG